jgi:hypothetical protein
LVVRSAAPIKNGAEISNRLLLIQAVASLCMSTAPSIRRRLVGEAKLKAKPFG